MRFAKTLAMLPAALLLAAPVMADEVNYETKNGVTYMVTRRLVPRTIWEQKVDKQEQVINESKHTTDIKHSEHRYMAPVTDYRWEPQWVTPWNPFAAPYVTYRWVPTTRWEERTQTVATPYTRTEYIPKKITREIPVSTPRIVHEEHISRVPVSVRPGSATDPLTRGGDESVARETGGRRFDDDPPRYAPTDAAESVRR
jgi:hypothetical protein